MTAPHQLPETEWSQDPINNPIEIGEPRDEAAASRTELTARPA